MGSAKNKNPSDSSQMDSSVVSSAKITKKAKPVKKSKWKYILCAAASFVFLVAVLVFIVIFFNKESGKKPQAEEQKANSTSRVWHRKKICTAQCAKEGYEKPPLVIISFDGFAREYLDNPGWVKWLKKVSNCGVTAEKVFPSFPSKTFVNHYSIVTGLYPAFHGIVDNAFWDKKLNPTKVESMKHATNDKYYTGEPLWSIYQRLTKGKTRCNMWPGSYYNNHGHPCNFTVYNHNTSFEERWNTIRKSLLLPENERPGLIISYFHEPDETGHKKKFHNQRPEYGKNHDLKNKVKEMDNAVDKFLQRMSDDGLLNCVNFVFLSDHGMGSMKKVVTPNELITKRKEFVGGTVARVYADKKDVDEYLANISAKCEQNKKDFYVSTDETRPLRFHHSGNPRVGDILFEGRQGVMINQLTDKHGKKKDFVGEHGYDYLFKDMQTAFFATGPSLKAGTVLKPFQNVEYLNLWLELLGIDSGKVRNNGTAGALDDALRNPPHRSNGESPNFEKCGRAVVSTSCCSSFPVDCPKMSPSSLFRTRLNFCQQNDKMFCGKTLLTLENQMRGVIESIEKSTNKGCPVAVGSDKCGAAQANFSMAADFTVEISSLSTAFQGVFEKTVQSTLEKFRDVLLKKYKKAVVLSGTAVDKDMDGIADSNQSQPPNLFFRLFVFCRDGHWKEDGVSCVSADQMDTRAFVFPLLEKDPNCLDGGDLLRYYSARVRDIELVTGIEFFPSGLSFTERATVRTKIDEDFFL